MVEACECVLWQLSEAEGELEAMTKNRDELQAVVSELEEKVSKASTVIGLSRIACKLCSASFDHS